MPNLLEIKCHGCDILTKKAEPITEITPEIQSLIEDMIHTMYESDGCGLAAPQIGVSKRIFVCDPEYSTTENRKPLVFINPEFIEFEGEQSREEGCLSFPNLYEEVKRFMKVKVKYQDENLKTMTITADDIFATIIQHETDHLNGILLTDKMNPMRKMAQAFKLSKIANKGKKMSDEMVIL